MGGPAPRTDAQDSKDRPPVSETRTLPDAQTRAPYPHWCREQTRFADLDPLGHVNNNAIGVYFETGRLEFFNAAALLDGMRDTATVVVRFTIDFHRELTHPATLDIGTRLVRVGSSSFTYSQAIFHGDVCISTAETVSVLFDLKARTGKALTDGQKERLTAFL